jgi:hypothetical protein
MLRRKEVEIAGEMYEFREPTIEAMLPVLQKMGVAELRMEAQLDLLAVTVFQNGEPLGEAVKHKGWSLFASLVPHSLDVCGMTAEEDDESA